MNHLTASTCLTGPQGMLVLLSRQESAQWKTVMVQYMTWPVWAWPMITTRLQTLYRIRDMWSMFVGHWCTKKVGISIDLKCIKIKWNMKLQLSLIMVNRERYVQVYADSENQIRWRLQQLSGFTMFPCLKTATVKNKHIDQNTGMNEPISGMLLEIATFSKGLLKFCLDFVWIV